jgi:dipeptidyl-peptidase-4
MFDSGADLPSDRAVSSPASAAFLREFGETRGYLLGRPARPIITPGGDAVVFLRSGPRNSDQELHELDLATGRSRLLVRPDDLLAGVSEEISPEEQARRERQRITDRGFTAFVLSPDGASILLAFAGRLFLVARATGAARALTRAEAAAPLDPRFSPDGKRIAFVRGGNLHVLELEGTGLGEPRAITSGADEHRFFGLAEFVAQEEMARFEGYWWSPDSGRLAYAEVDQRGVERFAIADPARPERAPQTFAYPRAGRANARVRLAITALAPGAHPLAIDWDRERYPYLARVLWDVPAAPLSLLVQSRDQREVALLEVDEVTGSTRPLVVENDVDWINLERDLPRRLPDGSILWATEKDGARALVRIRADGSFDRTLLDAQAGLIAVVHVGRATEPGANEHPTIHVLCGDALVSRLERVDLASGARQVILDDPGALLDRTVQVSRDGKAVLETRTGPTLLPETRVLLFEAGSSMPRPVVVPSVAVTPPFRVNLQLCTTGGDPSFHAALVRPRDFTPGRRYPVILHVYGGPHSQMVKADERHYLLDQWIADHGVVVVAIDNRGTPRRGRAWERAIKGRFGDLPLEDQIAGLTALGRQFPELDLDRVGVFGWSFGGYLAALAVLRRPDFFKAGAAGAPVVDWLDYDTHYTERYLDLPERNPEAYRAASLITHAAELSRPLLLIHGTADDNVYFFHSLKLAEALLRAGRSFEFLPLPRVTHQMADPALREQVWQRVTSFLIGKI